MQTKHESLFDGKLQTLSLFNGERMTLCIAMMHPGEFNLGRAKTRQLITVTGGMLTINGKNHGSGYICVVTQGDEIVITAQEPSSYTLRHLE
jgi:uncharacterized protein YaiE (UPF0345 family)